MEIVKLENVGRRYNKHWVFRNLSYTILKGQSYAILGPNGSGKSTLLQLIAGSLTPSEGCIQFKTKNQQVNIENIYRHLSIVAPYLDLIEEFTYKEALNFHFKFKTLLPGYQISDVFDYLQLPTQKNRLVKDFSSGMKQRLKLALAFFSSTELLLLDEPTSNLDHQGEQWYLSLYEQLGKDRTSIISSNQEIEYQFCRHHIQIQHYKEKK